MSGSLKERRHGHSKRMAGLGRSHPSSPAARLWVLLGTLLVTTGQAGSLQFFVPGDKTRPFSTLDDMKHGQCPPSCHFVAVARHSQPPVSPGRIVHSGSAKQMRVRFRLS